MKRPSNRIGVILITGLLLVFSFNPLIASEKKLKAEDGSQFDKFGYATAISGDFVIIGAPGEDNGAFDRGSAYIFYKDEGGSNNWGQKVKLIASDADASDQFGMAVDIDGDIALVGARFEDSNGQNAGAAYVFYRSQDGTNNWTEVKKILASDGDQDDDFGHSVGVHGNYIIIGAPGEDDGVFSAGAAYIYYRHSGGNDQWGEVKKITANDAATKDNFGAAVGITDGFVIVGAFGEDSMADDAGAAYIYDQNEGSTNNWGQVAKILADDSSDYSEFGYSVAIDGEYAAVGSHADDVTGSNIGSVYMFRKDRGGDKNWGKTMKLLAGGGSDGDEFGISVSLDGDFLIVGAYQDDSMANDGGAIYVYYHMPEVQDYWWQMKKIVQGDSDRSDLFGFSTGVSDDKIIIGAFFDDGSAQDAGAAYLVSDELVVPTTSINLSSISEDSKINLFWSPSPSSNTTSYYILRGTSSTKFDYLLTVSKSTQQYSDLTVTNNTTYYYKIASIDDQGNVNEYSNVVNATPEESTLGTESENGLPDKFAVFQNYPNPFNPTTIIQYALPEQQFVQVVIFDMLGKEIKTLVSDIENAGIKSVTWDGTNSDGKYLSGGIYFYRVTMGQHTETRRMLLLK
jgi:hypothetical protein